MKKTLNLEKIQQYARRFAKERDWEKFHTPKNLVMGLAGEVGELIEIFQWLSEREAETVMNDPKKAKEIQHELADVFLYVTRLSDILKVDLEKAFWEKMKINEKKYPVELARGNAKKYHELVKGSQP